MPTTLQDLPVELLALICDELGGSELRRRRGPERRTMLALCRKWYDAARSVYNSGLEVANVNVFGWNLDSLTEGRLSYAHGNRGRPLMHKNTRRLRVRLLDNPWDKLGAEVISQNPGINSEDDFDGLPDPPEYPGNRWDWARPPDLSDDADFETWTTWPSKVKTNLEELFGDLRNFQALDQIIVEASGTFEVETRDGDAHYINKKTIYHLATNLPVMQNLSALTLDLCGSNLMPLCDARHDVCSALARMWPRVQTVRIRMRRICPAIFAIPDPVTLPPYEVRCKSFVLKLHIPAFQAGRDTYDVHPCLDLEDHISVPTLPSMIVRAGRKCVSQVRNDHGHSMDLFRISCTHGAGPSVFCVDCLTGRQLYLPEEFFCYEDDGTPCWFEHHTNLRDGGEYQSGKARGR